MRYVLVTGAGGGMGRAAVRRLLAEGYGVIALDRAPCEAIPGVLSLTADVTDEDSLAAARKTVRTVTDTLFAIVHFAGVYMLDSLAEMESERFRRAFDVNLLGAFLVNRTFLPLLGCGGRILITTSELAPLDPLPFTGIYAVTKGALDKYAYSLRMELQLSGIEVSVLRAGAVDTGMLAASTQELSRFCDRTKRYAVSAARFRRIVERVEARRVPPEKIAGRVVRILAARRPRFAYAINRNPLLLLLNALPKRVQCRVIRLVLRPDVQSASSPKKSR